MATVLRDLWDFDDPAGSEQRFRALAEEVGEPGAGRALTQVARALGLQERYAEGHAVLDDLSPADPEARVRLALERGTVAWSLRHLGRVEEARAMQLALEAELRAAGEHDPYVEEELDLLR